MRKNLVTIVLMAGALLAVFFLTFHLHQTSKEKILSQFNKNQLLVAQQVARQIESYFRSRFQDLRWFSSIASLQDTDREKMAADIQSHFERLKMIHVNEISLLDEKGTVSYSTTAAVRGANHSQADFFSWARDPVNKGSVRIGYEKTDGWRSPMTAGSPAPLPPSFFLVTPLYRESAAGGRQKPGGKFAGVIMCTVDLEKMLAERSLLFTPLMKLHSLWIMDRDGTVLLQSEHPEMLMRSIRGKDGTCNQCHASFDHVETMLGKAEGVTEYQLKGDPKKVAAFAAMSFANASWVVVVNAPLDEVTAFVQTHFKETIFILGIVTLVLGLAFYFAYRNYRRRVDGEMEVRHLRDQQKLMEELRETRDYLENLFGYANAPIIVWDPQFRITRFNRAFERLTGYAAGEVIGRELQMLFPEGSREESLSLIARTLSGEYWESVEIPILRKDGNTRLALWNSANLYTTDGATLIATIAQGQDITERKQAERDRRHRIRELDVLYKISRSTAQSLNLHETLKNAVEATIEALHVEAGGIFLLEPDGRTMTMRAHCGLSDEFFRNVQKINIGEGISGRAAAERKVIVLNVSDYPSERLAPFIVREGFHVLASAPLISSGETIGALNLGMRHPRTFTPEEMRLLEAIGQMLGQAVRNAQLYESVQQELAERKQAEEALRRTEENFRHSLDDLPMGVRIVTIEGETIYANRAILDIYGYDSIEELKTTPVAKRYTPESYAGFRNRREKRRQGVDDPSEYGIDIIRKNGEVHHLQVFRKEVLWDGEIQYQVLYQDITERKQAADRELLAREVLNLLNRTEDETDVIRDILLMVKKSQGFEAVGIRLKEGDDFPYFRTDGFPDHFVKAERYLCVHNGEGKIVRDEQGNPVLECMCGNIICGRINAALPFFTENGSFWTNSTTDLLVSTTDKDRLACTRNRCNAEGYESVTLIPLRSGDEIIGLLQINDHRRNRFTLEVIRFFEGLGSSIGIALSRKQQITKLIRSDREKTLLLKEIHHRVKNNLQIIASLLRLSTKYSGDERVEEIFRESQDRIRAMAAVHSMLYKSENFAEINFGEYIRETARQLFRSYNTNHEAISLLINAEDVMLSIDTAIPCGLIINELISNALKHAFPDGRRGEIRIEMNQDENGVRIIFEDNGAGFPAGMDFRNTETLGLQLVNMLVAQLDGAIEMVRNGGTRYVITLKTGKEI
ncbi:MAG: PAS domain S-box protein [Syntrophales bacterium]|nr:PAS domain S-box protein [Syntrophales bacterium]